jgi:hypothetical protein
MATHLVCINRAVSRKHSEGGSPCLRISDEVLFLVEWRIPLELFVVNCTTAWGKTPQLSSRYAVLRIFDLVRTRFTGSLARLTYARAMCVFQEAVLKWQKEAIKRGQEWP